MQKEISKMKRRRIQSKKQMCQLQADHGERHVEFRIERSEDVSDCANGEALDRWITGNQDTVVERDEFIDHREVAKRAQAQHSQ